MRTRKRVGQFNTVTQSWIHKRLLDRQQSFEGSPPSRSEKKKLHWWNGMSSLVYHLYRTLCPGTALITYQGYSTCLITAFVLTTVCCKDKQAYNLLNVTCSQWESYWQQYTLELSTDILKCWIVWIQSTNTNLCVASRTDAPAISTPLSTGFSDVFFYIKTSPKSNANPSSSITMFIYLARFPIRAGNVC